MKVIDIQNSYPGFNNDFIAYQGKLDGVIAGKTNFGKKFVVTTEIKSAILVKGHCEINGIFSELPYTLATNTDGNYVVTFQVRDNSTGHYYIQGLKTKPASIEEDLSVAAQASSAMDMSMLHNHNGMNSPYISATHIYAGTENAGKTVIVGENGFLTFADAVIELPVAPTELTLKGKDLLVYEATNGDFLPLSEEDFADMNVQWVTDGELGAGETGATYQVFVQAMYDDGLTGPGGPQWRTVKAAASDNTGADATKLNWDISTEASAILASYPNADWRIYVVATLTSSGGQTVSAFGRFKYDG